MKREPGNRGKASSLALCAECSFTGSERGTCRGLAAGPQTRVPGGNARVHTSTQGFPGGSVVRQCRRRRFDPWVGKIPWRSGNPLQCSCLENPMDRGAWWATVHGVAPSPIRLKRLGTHTHTPQLRAWAEGPPETPWFKTAAGRCSGAGGVLRAPPASGAGAAQPRPSPWGGPAHQLRGKTALSFVQNHIRSGSIGPSDTGQEDLDGDPLRRAGDSTTNSTEQGPYFPQFHSHPVRGTHFTDRKTRNEWVQSHHCCMTEPKVHLQHGHSALKTQFHSSARGRTQAAGCGESHTLQALGGTCPNGGFVVKIKAWATSPESLYMRPNFSKNNLNGVKC